MNTATNPASPSRWRGAYARLAVALVIYVPLGFHYLLWPIGVGVGSVHYFKSWTYDKPIRAARIIMRVFAAAGFLALIIAATCLWFGLTTTAVVFAAGYLGLGWPAASMESEANKRVDAICRRDGYSR